MTFYLFALGGPQKDRSFRLRPGFVLGRTEGDLVLPEDPKLSSRHAYIDQEGEDVYLVDNDSKNGVWLNNELIKRIKIEVGQQLTIGTYTYEIRDKNTEAELSPNTKSRYWHEHILNFGERHLHKIENQPKPILPLHPAIVLDFVRGIQAETRWVLGYGPRRVGATSMDLPIFEPGAPPLCFEILPTPTGISFKTEHPDKVKLNGKGVHAQILRIADIIRINGTEIEVDFIE